MPAAITQVKSVCPLNCPDTCGIITTVEDGRVVRTVGDPDHPITRGWLCRKGNRYLERHTSPDRLLYPMRRVGRKGEGRFDRISWDDALDLIAERWQATVAEWGPEAILPYGYSGTMGVVQRTVGERRFLNRLGASILDRSICSEAGHAAMKATLGGSYGADPEDVPNRRLAPPAVPRHRRRPGAGADPPSVQGWGRGPGVSGDKHRWVGGAARAGGR